MQWEDQSSNCYNVGFLPFWPQFVVLNCQLNLGSSGLQILYYYSNTIQISLHPSVMLRFWSFWLEISSILSILGNFGILKEKSLFSCPKLQWPIRLVRQKGMSDDLMWLEIGRKQEWYIEFWVLDAQVSWRPSSELGDLCPRW